MSRSTSGDWAVTEDVGWAAKYESATYPDWAIYEQPSGFMVWQHFHFRGRCESFDEATRMAAGTAD